MTKATKQKHASQMQSEDAQVVAPCKKMKKTVGPGVPSKSICHSSRTNMGKGGQIAQLESIEPVQTQNSTKVSKLAAATAHEPLNPMAPTAIDTRTYSSKDSSGNMTLDGSQMHPSSRTAPLTTYQASTEGSHYGFNTKGTFSQEPTFTALHSQAPVVSVATRHSSITPTLCRSTPQTFNVISFRTHSLEEMTYQSQDSFASELPPYRSRNGNGIPGGNSNNFSGSQLHREASYQLNELFIEELSPNEDELAAVKALQEPNGLPNVRHIPNNSDIDPALLTEEHNNSDNGTRPVSGNRDTDPAVSVEEHSDHGIAHDVINEHHQHNRFPRPPDPSTLWDVCLQQQHSNARRQNHAHINNEVLSAFISVPQCPPQALPTPSQAVPVPSQVVPAPPQALSVDVPPGPLDGSATKLRAYPLCFCALIERAKLIAQCDAASNDPFMPCSQFIEEKRFEFFNMALMETQNVSQGYWPQYHKELSVLVWEAMMTWHSTLKSKARELVPRFYALGDEILPPDNKA
ncbi:hypothetical protein OG21DRAFT_1489989 [Imleria badia]|nr:hypothetical protein OG21DRAFT_1489989 [Imleria badia]